MKMHERGKPPFRNPPHPPKKLMIDDKSRVPFRNPVNPPPIPQPK